MGALTVQEWQDWRDHIDSVVESTGEWVGLVNGEFEPVCDLPPVVSLEGSRSLNEPSELTVAFPALTPQKTACLALDHLVDEGFGAQDETSRLQFTANKAWFIVVQRAGGERNRHIYKVVFPNVGFEGFEPTDVRVEAVDALVLLQFWPCPSVPAIWGNVPIQDWHEDAGGKYDRAYRYAPVEMATVARGYTLNGPADTSIMRIVQESLDAGNRVHPEWVVPHMVVDRTRSLEFSPRVLIQRTDATIWDTIADAANSTNVGVRVDVWWPGDADFPVDFEHLNARREGAWSQVFPSTPVLVCRVEQGGFQ